MEIGIGLGITNGGGAGGAPLGGYVPPADSAATRITEGDAGSVTRVTEGDAGTLDRTTEGT